jgi:hypothetical protein
VKCVLLPALEFRCCLVRPEADHRRPLSAARLDFRCTFSARSVGEPALSPLAPADVKNRRATASSSEFNVSPHYREHVVEVVLDPLINRDDIPKRTRFSPPMAAAFGRHQFSQIRGRQPLPIGAKDSLPPILRHVTLAISLFGDEQ